MTRLLLYIIIVIFPFSIKGQQVYFKNYQVDNGLSSNTITAILQDSKGFIWLGTRNGLNRFDGNHFKVYRSDQNDPNSIGNHSITAISEDSSKNLWIGTYKGIYHYTPRTESFELVFAEHPFVTDIQSDNKGGVWFISDQKLYRLSVQKRQISFVLQQFGELSAFAFGSQQSIWVADRNGTIAQINQEGKALQTFDLTGINKGISINTIQKIYPVNDSSLLIGTMNNLYLFELKSKKLQSLLPEHVPHQVHAIIHQEEDTYWIGTEIGLFILDLKDHSSRKIIKEYANPYALTDNVIYALWKDKEGAIWIGTFSGGINYYAPALNYFQKYYPSASKNQLSGSIVHEICEDDYGNIWIGTEDGGVNQLHKKTGRITSYLPSGKPGSIAYQNIHGLVAFKNELWIGTYEHGLDVLDIQTGKVIRHYETGPHPGSLNGNFIISLYKNKKNEILVGNWNGLSIYDRKNNRFINDTFFTVPIQSILEDHQNILWVGSYGGGVYWRNQTTGETGKFLHDADNKYSLISNFVNNVYQDSNHDLWFCTESGISKLNYSTRQFETIQLGLLNDYQVFRIVEDRHHTFWITTSKGLVHYLPATGQTKIYTTSDGLLTEQFNYNSSYQSEDGTIYLGTVKGMISFHPDQIEETGYKPPIYITGFQSNNVTINSHDNTYPAGSSILYAQSITLPYDSSNISFDVACLSYITPEKNEYLYKMEGVDDNWTLLKNNRTIYYTKLSPGTYTFKVKGGRTVEESNIAIASIQVKILPPWYLSGWAYLTYLLIIASVIYLIIRYYNLAHEERTKRRLEFVEREKEREIHHAKIEFFTNIAHEIRTPLTLIKLPLDKLHADLENDSLYKENLSMMKKNTNRLIELTDQLLDFRKAEANKFTLNFINTDINELLRELYQSFLPAAEQRKLEMNLEVPRVSLLAYVDPEALKKIITNLINNAIKYADKKITIKLFPFYSDATAFEIGVKSDGYKIPGSLREKIFEPFYRIKETEKTAGTGIGLSLARSLAELHNGSLILRNTEDALNEFMLTIPIHQEEEIHFTDKIPEDHLPSETIGVDENKIKILIVEDQKEIVRFLQKELKDEFGIYSAYNGKEALEILEKENIQIVISDIMMPVMDGIELTKKIKRDVQYSHIPVVLLTAKNTIHSKIEGLEAGADAYIEKPFSLEHLTAQINNLLANRSIIKEYFSKGAVINLKGTKLSSVDQQFIESLHRHILENITDADLDVDKLSKLMNMSRATFYRKVKSISDLSPNELIIAARLKKSAELLIEEGLKIKEVVSMVGYSNSSNFSRDFSKQFGMTPSQYIAENKTG